MTIQSSKFQGKIVNVGDSVVVELADTHLWAKDYASKKMTIVVNSIDTQGVLGGWSVERTTADWPGYIALSDDGDPKFKCKLISVTKPTKE